MRPISAKRSREDVVIAEPSVREVSPRVMLDEERCSGQVPSMHLNHPACGAFRRDGRAPRQMSPIPSGIEDAADRFCSPTTHSSFLKSALPAMSTSTTPSPPPFASTRLQDAPRGGHWQPLHHYSTSHSSIDTTSSTRSSISSERSGSISISYTSSALDRSASPARRSQSTSVPSKLCKFMDRQSQLLLERYTRCHVVAIPRGSPSPSLQALGSRDSDGERVEEGTAVHQTILYCGQDAEVVIDFVVFDTGRLSVKEEE